VKGPRLSEEIHGVGRLHSEVVHHTSDAVLVEERTVVALALMLRIE